MSDAYDILRQKVLVIFQELAGDRARRLDPGVLATPAMDAITLAFLDEYGVDKATKVGLNMADWNWDAAFIVSVHLYPERFTPEEIRSGVAFFLTHAPNHIREACHLTGQYVWEDFPYDEPNETA